MHCFELDMQNKTLNTNCMIFNIVGMCSPLHARMPISPNHCNNQGHFYNRNNNELKERH